MRNIQGKCNCTVLCNTLIAVLFLFNFCVDLSSQSIAFDKVSTNSICEETTVNLSILNDSGSELEASDLILQLPCGFIYEAGSINGLNEKNSCYIQSACSFILYKLLTSNCRLFNSRINPFQKVEVM